MSEQKWSPGPWRACKDGDCTCGFVWSVPADAPVAEVTIGPWGDRVAVIGDDGPKIDMLEYGSIPEEIGKANARLIAAAPELYAVLADAKVTLEEAAEVLARDYPSLANNIVNQCAIRCGDILRKARGEP